MSYEIVWIFISYFGDMGYWLGFTAAFFIVFSLSAREDRKKYSWVIYALLPAVLSAYILHHVLEIIFKVPRPCAGLVGCPSGYSFPSGHASVIFAFMSVTLLFERKRKYYLWSIPLAILVGLSRVMLDFHRPVDIIGGLIIGVVATLLVYKFSDQIKYILSKMRVLDKN